MPSVLRSVVVFSFVSALAIMSAPGCSQQGEGERCDSAKNGDLDCDDGLTCVKKAELQVGVTDRCCPAENTESDTRCSRGTPTATGGTNSGGSSNSAGDAAGGTASSAGESAGGVPGSSGSGTMSEGGMSGGTVGSTDGGTPAAGATTGGAGNPSNGGQGGAD